MNRLIPAAERHFQDFGWLKTHWLFSFDTYHDPGNLRHGILRVYNDDVVAPGTGFPTHPHHEMEIVTLVWDGAITHADSLGNTAEITAGEVQRMTAGTGITHSEWNRGTTPVHFHQIWLLPRQPRLSPGYDQRRFESGELQGRLVPVASGNGAGGISLQADATIWRGAFEPSQCQEFRPPAGHRLFLYVSSGTLDAEASRLAAGDQLRLESGAPIFLRAVTNVSFVLIDAS